MSTPINSTDKMLSTKSDEKASDLRWLDQRADTMQMLMKDNVDIAGNQAKVSVTLLHQPISTSLPLSLSASYSSSSDIPKNGLLGSGWSLYHPLDFIVVDCKGGIFPETFDYTLMVNSKLEQLIPIPNSTSVPGISKFGLKNDKTDTKIEIVYDRPNERWTINSKNILAVFGRSPNRSQVQDAVQETLYWKNWRGFGYSDENLDSLQNVAQAWYLISREEKHGYKTKLLYDYHIEEASLPNGKGYTSLVELKCIRTENLDTENGMRLDLHYGEKTRKEYHVQSPKNSRGHYRFPVFLQSKLFFKGFTLQTGKNLRQEIRLEYQLRGKERLLTEINQIYNEEFTESLFKFFYGEFEEGATKRHLMCEARFGVGEQNGIKYFYKQLQVPVLDFGPDINTREYLTTKNMQLKIGEKYSVIASHMGAMVSVINILNKELSVPIASLEFDLHIDYGIAGETIDEYEIMVYPQLLGVFLTSKAHDENKEGMQYLILFNCNLKGGGKWSKKSVLFSSFAKKDLFRRSENIMLIARQTGVLEIFEPDENDNGFKVSSISVSSNGIKRCVIQDSIILAFDGHSLFTVSRNRDSKIWTKNSNFADVTSKEVDFQNKVSMNEQVANILSQQITKYGLQMYKNMVLLSEWGWENDFFSCKTNLYILDESYRIHKAETFISGGELANKHIHYFIKFEEQDETVMTFRYIFVDSKYKVQLVHLSGKIRNDMVDECKEAYGDECPEDVLRFIEEEIEKLIKNINIEQDYTFRDLMLFDPLPCLSYQLDGSGAVTNSSIIHMQGNSWAQEWVENPSNVSSIALHSTFVLESTRHKNQTDFRLFVQNPEDGGKEGTPLEIFNVGVNGTLALGFPSYIAYQTSRHDPIVIIPFLGNCTGKKIEKTGQQLLGMSTANTLLTYEIFDDPLLYPKNTRVFVRQINSLIPSQPFHVLERCEVTAENGEVVRLTAYENEFFSNSTSKQQENTVRIIPTASPSYSGTYEEVTIIPIDAPTNATKTQRWVDTEGVLVRSKVIEVSGSVNATKPTDDPHTLLDTSGNLKIMDIFPYNLTQNMVAYYGFEIYENSSLFGTNLKFDGENVVTNGGDSLTGKSLLRLGEGQKLSLTLNPTEQSFSYTTSCWIRPKITGGQENFEYDTPVNYFRAIVGFDLENEQILTPFLTIYGQMKLQVDNWLYLELTTDLEKIRNNAYTVFYKQIEEDEVVIPLPAPVFSNFTISIEIEPPQGNQLDLDHIKFLPTESDLSIKVYNIRWQETETILHNGAITRKLYHDISGEEIAELNENGEVELFRSISKCGSLFPGDSNATIGSGMKSELAFIPNSSSFERFNIFQFETGRWETNKLSNWEMHGAGKIAHLGVNQITELKVGTPDNMFGNGFVSSALSFHFKFSSDVDIKSIQIILGANRHLLIDIKSLDSNSSCVLDIYGKSTATQRVPCHGQLVLLIENQRMWLWFDGFLIHEGSTGLPNPWSNLVINARGLLSFSNMLIFNKPQVFVSYFNGFGQRTQSLKLESRNEIMISEVIYDEMGRESIRTKTGRLRREGSEPILKYYPNLVSNKSPLHHNSIFRTNVVEGLLAEMYPEDEGYSYGRTFYMNDLTGEVAVKGYPGKDFLQGGKFVKEYSRQSNIVFLYDLFPPHEGFTQKVLKEPNSNVHVTIFDSKGREVGDYTQMPGYSHILTTYEYDDEGNVLKILPPRYHQQVDSYRRKISLSKGERTGIETYWAEKLGTHFTYNEANQIKSKKTPDIVGRQEYLYDMLGNLRFFYTVRNNVAQDIIYLLHSGTNKPIEIGYIDEKLPAETLHLFQNTTEVPNSETHVYQRIIYSDAHSDPSLRGRVKLFMTYNGGELEEFTSDNGPPHQELLKFDSSRKLRLKTTNTATSRAAQSEALTSMHMHYKAGKIAELQYPREAEIGNSTSIPLTLIISHDRCGHLTALGTRENPSQFASFAYSPSGSLLSESIEPSSTFEITRNFEYNTPGLLTKISDPFLTQKLSFTDSGYGQLGFGDGIVMSTQFEASWAKNASMYDSKMYREWFSIPVRDYGSDEIMSMCLKALTRVGFLDKFYGIPQKFLGHSELSLLPLACGGSTGHKLMTLLGAKLPPIREYGHTYSYGNYKELTKSKFFAESDSFPSPLQVNTFHKELPSFVENADKSDRIWDALVSGGFIIVDNARPEDKFTAVGKEGNNPIFCYNQLRSDLEAVDYLAITYTRPIIHLLFDIISKAEPMITLTAFQDTYVTWLGYIDNPLTPIVVVNKAKQDAQKIYEMLEQRGYISGDMNSILEESFKVSLAPFRNLLPQIAAVLRNHFIFQLGLSINDYESVSVDPNGNHKSFFVGFNRHTLEYSENTNKISRLSVQDPFAPIGEEITVFELDHNPQGNVCKAQHRNVDLIRYHPVTNRPVYMLLTDGRKLVFQYDSQGERILKRVYDSMNSLLSEVTYLRDETGRVIRDIRTKFGDNQMSITTTYIYGPRGLLGFIRGSKFFSVFTDHAGSIRLVTQGGKVQAAYDYWPYGSHMREVGDVNTHIYYRYTGQEYDEETGLYNYHARLYDPLLGRFYQPDPKSQYPSPYVYAGNSPLSMVDPDGEFVEIILAIIFAIVVAYIAAAAANGTWDFTQWDWDNKTFLALIGGAVIGAALPLAFMSLAGVIGYGSTIAVGLVGSYVAAGNEFGWNPFSWDWASPELYNAFLTGFVNGLAISPETIEFIQHLGELGGLLKNGQIDLLFNQLFNGIGNAYLLGLLANGDIINFLNWDWTSKETWDAIRNGFYLGSTAPTGYLEYLQTFFEAIRGLEANAQSRDGNLGARFAMQNKEILRDKAHPLFTSLGESLVGQLSENIGRHQMGPPNNLKWDKKVSSTFEGILNDMMEEPELLKMVNEFRASVLKLPQERYFERLSSQRNALSTTIRQFQRGILQLSNFYFKASSEDLDYGLELQPLLVDLNAGGKIHVEFGILGNFVDCVHSKSIQGHDIEKCNINSNFGRKNFQNRELIYKLFRQSQNYENRDGFIQVENPSQISDEFLENLLYILRDIPGNSVPGFLYDIFIGATYHSHLSLNQDIFIKRQPFSQDLELLHLALLKNEVLFVRTVAIGSEENFEDSQLLIEYISNQKFKCQIESAADRERIKRIHGEMNFIQIRQNIKDKIKLFTHTPELTLSCKVGSNPIFFKKVPSNPPPGGESVFQDFEAFNLVRNDGQKAFEIFKQFSSGTMAIFKSMKTDLGDEGNYSFTGFMLGFIIGNLRQTFDVQFAIQSRSKIVFVGWDNGYGVDNWKATPAIINLNSGVYVDFDSPNETYSLSEFTLATEAVGADVHEDTDLLSYSIRALPNFEGFWELHESTSKIIRESLKYLFYSLARQDSMNKGETNSLKNKHFVSNSILGELLAEVTDGLKIFIFTGINQNDKERLKAQRLFLIFDEETGNGTIFNVVESSKISENGHDFEFDPEVNSDIPSLPLGVQITNLMEIKISLNINSQACWKYKEVDVDDGLETCFFQGLEKRIVENLSDIPVQSSYFEIKRIEIQPNGFLYFGHKHIQKLFTKLATNDFKPFLKTDIDLSSIVSAYLFEVERSHTSDKDGLQLRIRQRISSTLFPLEHSLLSVTDLGDVVPGSEQVLLQNIIHNSEGNAAEALENAEEELKAYYCSQPERFSEFLRVTDVPAVYGPRLRFEVEPDVLYQPNCSSNASTLYSRIHKKGFDAAPASSSATSHTTPGIFPTGLLSRLKGFFSDFIFGKPKPTEEACPNGKPRNCQQGAWHDGAYNMDGITCYMGGLKVMVFPSVEPTNILSFKEGNIPPNLLPLMGDTYLKSTCDSIEFNTIPSVTCKGQRSTFIYTPYHQERLFDNADGNILLGRVILHLGAKLIGYGHSENLKNPEVSTKISHEEIIKWRKIICKIQNMMVDMKDDEVNWVNPLLEDCKDFLAQIENQFAKIKNLKRQCKLDFDVDQFKERLFALYDDLVEQVQFSSHARETTKPTNGFKNDCGMTGGFGKNPNEFVAQNVVLKNGNVFNANNNAVN